MSHMQTELSEINLLFVSCLTYVKPQVSIDDLSEVITCILVSKFFFNLNRSLTGSKR